MEPKKIKKNIYLVIESDKQNKNIGTPCAKYNPVILLSKWLKKTVLILTN